MASKRVLLAAAVLVVSVLVSAVASAASSARTHAGAEASVAAAPNMAVPNLRGRSFTIVSTEPGTNTVVLFKALDYMRQWGANVTVRHVSAPANVVAAVGAGQADIGDVPPLVGLQAQQAGLDIKAFAMSQARTDDVFVGKRSITSLGQLRGQSIGVLTTRGLNGIEVAQVLQVAGLSSNDVRVVVVGGQTVRVAALIAGRVDAGPISFDNYRAALEPAGFNLLYNYASQMPNLLRSFLWAKPSWISSNRVVAAAMNEALLRAFRWVSNTRNKQAFIRYARQHIPALTPAGVSQTYDDWVRFKIFHVNSAITRAAVQLQENLFLQHELITRRPASPNEWVDISFSANALNKLGRVRTRGANKLTATLNPNGAVRLAGAVGIFNGPAEILVRDTSTTHNIHLTGPRGLNRSTTAAFRGQVTWKLNLGPGTYRIRSDRAASRGSRFIVTESG
jgi:ABC-type nitrate/sulfonate/bicarbonate transport system substrate-binding protein